MNVKREGIPWGLFLLMCVVAGYLWFQLDAQDGQLDALTAHMAGTEAHIAELTASIASLEQQVEEKEQTVAMLREVAEDAAVETPQADGDAPDAAGMSDLTMGDMLDTLLSAEDAPLAPEGSGLAGMAEMFRGPQGEQMLEMSTRMSMDMQYGDFFDMLSPEYADVAREILGDYLMHTARIGMGLLGGDGDRESMTASMELARESMLTELQETIGDAGLALYEQYEEDLPGRMLDQAMEMQLGMFARGLSPETSEMVRHTLVEELLLVQPEDMFMMPDPETMQENMLHQQDAYDRALERLTPHLAQEEYEAVHRFIQQQQQMMSAVSSMMGVPAAE